MNYPKAPDKRVRKLSNILINYANQKGLEFSFSDNEVYPLETFAFFGCLPLFLVEAKEQYEKVFNKKYTVEELMSSFKSEFPTLSAEQLEKEKKYLDSVPIVKEFPVFFEMKEEDTYFGFIPRIPEGQGIDFSVIAHVTHYALDEYIKPFNKNKMLLVNGRIPLEPLYEKMVQKVNDKELVIRPTPTIRPTLSEEDRKEI